MKAKLLMEIVTQTLPGINVHVWAWLLQQKLRSRILGKPGDVSFFQWLPLALGYFTEITADSHW